MKTKTLIFAVMLLSVSIFLLGCKKLLEVKSSNYITLTDNYYNTEPELNYALNGVYAILAEGTLHGNNMLGRMGLEADEAYEYYSLDNKTVGYYDVQSTDAKVLTYWRDLYKGINRANYLVRSIDAGIQNVDKSIQNNIKGQALALRAYYYLMLVSRFQGVPLILEPIETAKAEVLQQPRSTGKEVYKQIIQDLEQAAPLVKPANEVIGGGRISKSAVWGLLARANLYLAGYPYNETDRYEVAARYADSVIISGYHRLNPSYKQIFVNYAQDLYDISESIFEVEFYSDGKGAIPASGMVGRNNGIGNSVIDDKFGFAIGALRATSYLYELYSTGDLRRDWAISDYEIKTVSSILTKVNWVSGSSTFSRHCGKFRRENEIIIPKLSTHTPQNFPILRYSDVLLMYAEAINESQGATAEALEALNKVKRRAYGFDQNVPNPAIDFMLLTYKPFQDEVRKERPRELCFEALRKNDVVRWNTFYQNMNQREVDVPPSTRPELIQAANYFRNANARDEWWPIPAYELGVNKKLTQNIGW